MIMDTESERSLVVAAARARAAVDSARAAAVAHCEGRLGRRAARSARSDALAALLGLLLVLEDLLGD